MQKLKKQLYNIIWKELERYVCQYIDIYTYTYTLVLLNESGGSVGGLLVHNKIPISWRNDSVFTFLSDNTKTPV